MTRYADWRVQHNRLELIRRELKRRGEVNILDLAKSFKVSEMTVRRDLDLLAEYGEVAKTRGGAICARKLVCEFTFRTESNRNPDEKVMIARKAVQYVEHGQVIVLDTGTTTLEVAKQLTGKRKIKVITVSLPAVSVMQFDPNIELIVLGGYLRDRSPDLHGPLTEQNLGLFKADIAFLGAGAIDEDGSVYTDDLRVLNLDRKMIEISKKVIVVADHSKFKEKAMCKVMGPESYQVLITGGGADMETVGKLRERGITVEIMGVEKLTPHQRVLKKIEEISNGQ
jgi:DeoR family transcriptional regulator, aga operon transcriptional repressor